jgi:hypothetical protein
MLRRMVALLAHDGRQSIDDVMEWSVAETQTWAREICELRIARYAKNPAVAALEE